MTHRIKCLCSPPYQIQKRLLFWWFDVTEIGDAGSSRIKSFDTLAEASKYILTRTYRIVEEKRPNRAPVYAIEKKTFFCWHALRWVIGAASHPYEFATLSAAKDYLTSLYKPIQVIPQDSYKRVVYPS